MIYVFSIDRPEPIQTLKQAGARSLIQALDVRNVSLSALGSHTPQTSTTHEFHYIASATSDNKSELSLWRKRM